MKKTDKKQQGITDVFRDVKKLFGFISIKRRYQLGCLFILQMISASSEVASLGAVIPFLGALVNADDIMTNPLYIPWLNFFGIENSAQMIAALAILFALAATIANALRLLTLWSQAHLAAAIGNDLISEIYNKLLYQPYEYHTNMNSSTLISNITNDFQGSMNIIRNAMMIATQGLVIIFISAALLAYNALITSIIALIIVSAYLVIGKFTRKYLINISRIRSDLFIKRLKSMQEGFGGIRDVLLFGYQPTYVKLFSNSDKTLRKAAANTNVINSAPRYIMEALSIIMICVLAATLTRVSGEKSVLPLLGTLALAANRLLPAVQQCYASFASILSSNVSLERTLDKLGLHVQVVNVLNENEKLQCKKSIQLKNVYFKYNSVDSPLDEKWTLDNINMSIRANTTVALVGQTGSGKSTIADLIMGLLRPAQGNILIDNIVLDENNMMSWRSNISHVPQSIYLSDATIAENIAFGIPKKDIDMSRVEEAANMAQLSEFIMNKPHAYEEIIGERGIRLSGGQRQRIGIARALYTKADVIVFDEATSGLDGVTETKVMEAVDALSSKMTVIIIAHRLSTVKNADEIFEIDKGKLVNHGSFSELENKSATFKKLIASTLMK